MQPRSVLVTQVIRERLSVTPILICSASFNLIKWTQSLAHSTWGTEEYLRELICNETAEFNLRVDYGLHIDVKEFFENNTDEDRVELGNPLCICLITAQTIKYYNILKENVCIYNDSIK